MNQGADLRLEREGRELAGVRERQQRLAGSGDGVASLGGVGVAGVGRGPIDTSSKLKVEMRAVFAVG